MESVGDNRRKQPINIFVAIQITAKPAEAIKDSIL